MPHYRRAELVRSRRGRRSRPFFTMIEMLVVMIIMSILVAMMLPSFERMALGSGVQGGTRAVSAQLRMTRQYAIANRERVALLMPSDSHTTSSAHGANVMPDRQWTAYRPCIVNSSNNWVDWVPNTEWQFVPAGAIIAEITGSSSLGDSEDGTTKIANIDENGNGTVDYTNVRAIVFAPTGRLVGGLPRYVHIFEGAVSGGESGGEKVSRNEENIRTLVIDNFTGRVSYDNEQLTP